jgi:hypothetical protein
MTMTTEKLYKYLGLGVAIFAFVFIVIKSLQVQTKVFNRSLEGFTDASTAKATDDNVAVDKTQIASRVVSNTNRMDDELVVSRYRKNYEDVLIDMDTNIKTYVLHGIMNNAEKISLNPGSAEAQKMLTAINTANDFRKTLNDAMSYLKQKP